MFKLRNSLFILINLCSILNGYELNKNVTVPTNNLREETLVTPRPLISPPISTQVETEETSTKFQEDEITTENQREDTSLPPALDEGSQVSQAPAEDDSHEAIDVDVPTTSLPVEEEESQENSNLTTTSSSSEEDDSHENLTSQSPPVVQDSQENTLTTKSRTTSTTEEPDVYQVLKDKKDKKDKYKPLLDWNNDFLYDDYEWKSNDWDEIPIPVKLQQRLKELNNTEQNLKQFPSNPLTMLVQQTPCECATGLCSCCTGMILSTFNSRACMKMKYIPEEFAFDFRFLMNNYELYKRRVSGRNPNPICISPARIPFVDVCATFSDIYFIGRNMHVCLEVGAFFEDYELFKRNFNCMRLGQQGVKLVKPEEGGGLSQKPAAAGVDADVDQGDDIEEYDEILS